jgi:hypothetical protein
MASFIVTDFPSKYSLSAVSDCAWRLVAARRATAETGKRRRQCMGVASMSGRLGRRALETGALNRVSK